MVRLRSLATLAWAAALSSMIESYAGRPLDIAHRQPDVRLPGDGEGVLAAKGLRQLQGFLQRPCEVAPGLTQTRSEDTPVVDAV